MIYEARAICLKDGREAILKTPNETDAKAMLSYITLASGESDYLLKTPEEWEGMTEAGEAAWIAAQRESKESTVIAVYVEGRLVGSGEIDRLAGKKTGHRAVLGLAVLDEYGGMGIGSALMDALIAVGEEMGCKMLELSVMARNERAMALYLRKGFVCVTRRPYAILHKDGRYGDEIGMMRVIDGGMERG